VIEKCVPVRPILIGAGRGARLAQNTDLVPKTLVPVLGRPMLEWVLEALAAGGFRPRDVVFIAGYRAEVLRERYPDFTYVENADWQNNNVLLSLLCARHLLGDGFLCSYTDIVYRPQPVADLMASPHDITLVCDTDWRRRYVGRTQHPESDAEKLLAEGSRVVRVSRQIESSEASGEYIGVARFSPAGAAQLVEAFDEAKKHYEGRVFREGRTFERAYLIDLVQWMIERGAEVHRVDTPGGYMEIDTEQDLAFAPQWWGAT
jgi:L-glutamine-phosphate cytidylyltransferase